MSKNTSDEQILTEEERADRDQVNSATQVAAKDSAEEEVKSRQQQLKEASAAKQKKAHRRNVERNLRNIQQCLLCENLDVLSNFHKNNPKLFNYQTFRQLYGSSEQIVNELKGIPKGAMEGFFCVRTSILSLLQPEIRIFKVTHETQGKSPDGVRRGTEDKSVTHPIHKEIIFSSVFGEESATSTQQYLTMESVKPNWRNVGLQRFVFNQFGKSHGAMEQNIQCQLQLYVKSLKDLIAVSPGSDARYVDLLLWPEAKVNRDTQQINPKHYEIKAVIGYKKPPQQALAGLNPTREEYEFLKNIELFNYTVSLTLHKYDFSIKETGEVDVTIDYYGRVDSIFNSAASSPLPGGIAVSKRSGNTEIKPRAMAGSHDFINFSSIKGKLGALVKAKQNPDLKISPPEDIVEELIKNPLFRELYDAAYEIQLSKDIESSDVQTAIDLLTTKESARLMLGVLRRKSMSIKEEAFKVFMQQLMDGNSHKKEIGERIFVMSVNKENMDSALGVINAAPGKADQAKRQEIKENTSNAIGLASKSVRVGKAKDLANLKKSLQDTENEAGRLASDAEAESSAQDPAAVDTVEEATKASIITSKSKGDSYEFYYLYLGDVIELAAKNAGMYAFLGSPEDTPFNPDTYVRDEIGKDYIFSNMRLLLGPLEYQIDGKIKSINLAEFPISFDVFRNWFISKVVREDNDKISLGVFLNKLINQLVLPALGADCLNPIKLNNTRFQNIYFTIPGNSAGEPGSRTIEMLPKKGKIDVTSAAFRTEYAIPASKKRLAGVQTMVQNSNDYRLTQVNSYKSLTSRKGDCKEDLKEGIYHFNIGSDKGLLKEMNFSKVDIPYLAEMRSARAIESGGDQLNQLAFPFNCNLKLVGNTLFIPGMFFYANPSFLGIGNPQDASSIAHQLNLGGYFLVLTTRTTIAPGTFETEIEGVTVGHGRVS